MAAKKKKKRAKRAPAKRSPVKRRKAKRRAKRRASTKGAKVARKDRFAELTAAHARAVERGEHHFASVLKRELTKGARARRR
jgi:hypothetical protein